MAVTASVENYVLIDACDDEGTWTGETPTDQTGFYKENSHCVGFVCRGVGDNDMSVSGNFNISGASHFHMWFMTVVIAELSYVQLYMSDGTNTGYWNMCHASDYPGGWMNLVCDYTRTPDSGTAPSMTAVTTVGIRINHTGLGKNAENTWFDHLYVGDGVIAYGDDGGSEFDLEDIYAIDNDSTTSGRGWGMITKFSGVYYMVGNLEIGDNSGTSDTKFQALNQTLVFEERKYNGSTQLLDAILYEIRCVGNGTGSTAIEFGDVLGGKGISGCNIMCNDTARAFKFTATDTNVGTLGLYATVFNTHGLVDLMINSATREVIGSTFTNSASQIQPNTMTFTENFIISGTSTDGSVLFESTSHNISYNNFINCSRATEFDTAGTYAMTGDQFSGNTYDVHFSASTGDLTINCGGTPVANPSPGKVENDSTGSVSIINTVTISVEVLNSGLNPIEGVQVYVNRATPTNYTSTTQSGGATDNDQGDSVFYTTVAINADTPAAGWLVIFDASSRTSQWYRYQSWTDATTDYFTLITEITGTADNTVGNYPDDPEYLYDTGVDFSASDIEEGDVIRNTTDGSWAQVIEVVSANVVYHTPLRGGTDNHWDTGDSYSFHTLVVDYSSDDYGRAPYINENTNASGIASSQVNYDSVQTLDIRIRHSSGTPKYLPYNTTGTLSSSGSSTTAILTQDRVA